MRTVAPIPAFHNLALRAPLALGLVAIAFGAPKPAPAQSFLGFRALGVPIETAGGRAIALGNLGIGLPQVAVSPTDPAISARLLEPTVTVSMQPSWGDFQIGDQSGTTRTTRFPLIAIGYPAARGGVVTLSVAGHMEQRWVGERDRLIEIGGEDVPISDRFETDGGTSVARLGWAQPLGDKLSLGVNAGLYVGRLAQVFDRTLDSLAVDGDVRPYTEEYNWGYSGFTLAAGFGFDPHELLHLGGAVEWSSDLTETPDDDTDGGVNSYDIPLRLTAGATGRLTQRLLVSTSFVYQDWSGAEGFPEGVVSGRKLSYGAGLEWRAVQRESRSIPIRLGYRSGAPPFRYQSQDPSESALSLGVGLNLVEFEGYRLGWIDIAVERASRTSLPLDESFWRATISLGVSRF